MDLILETVTTAAGSSSFSLSSGAAAAITTIAAITTQAPVPAAAATAHLCAENRRLYLTNFPCGEILPQGIFSAF